MKYEIKAKPTKYRGRLYRSRLEARWAAFFDLLGWEYEYEPIDFKHWSPDFLIKGYDNNRLYIEIKPVINDDIIKEYEQKIDKSNLFKADLDLELSDKNKYIICSEIHKHDDKILFGYQLYKNEIKDEIYFKWPIDISSMSLWWNGLITELGQGHSNRKSFIYQSDNERFEIINLWIESANEIMFLKPYDY